MTEPTRQLPGVKGQWILAAECPPTEADADTNGDVLVWPRDKFYCGRIIESPENVEPNRYWRPCDHADPRPFTLPALPAPEQAAAVKRKFVQLIPHPHGHTLWAIADDGTAWLAGQDDYYPDDNWRQLPPLPDREV
jgi:hypothetical protein